MIKHIGPISGIAAFGGSYISTAGYDNQVILWDPNTREAISRAYHDHLANQCQFSPCGRFLASASSDYTARLWTVPGMHLQTVFNGHHDDVEMASFSPEGDRLATCSRDHTIRVFWLDGQIQATLEGHQADVLSVVWDTRTGTLLSSSDDGTVRRWNPASGSLVETIDLQGVETDTIAITGNGTIFAGNDSGEIVCIDKSVVRTKAHVAGIKRLVYSAEHGLLISMSYDRQTALWRVCDDNVIEEFKRTFLPSVVWPRSCTFLGKNRVAAGTFGSSFATYDYVADEWDANNIDPCVGLNAVKLVHGKLYAVGDAGVVYCAGRAIATMGSLCNFISSLGETVLTGGQMGQLFDAETGQVLYQHRSPLNCGATFFRDNVEYVIIGTYTGEGLVFRDTPRGIVHVATLQLHENAIKGIACSRSIIFSVCADSAAALHRIGDFTRVMQVPHAHNRIANGCAAAGDEAFVSVSRDLQMRIWHDGEAQTFLSPHRNSIKCVAANSGGRLIATGSYGGTIAIFDRDAGDWVYFGRPSAAGISSITPGVYRDEFIASAYDGTVYTVSPTSLTERRVA